MYTYELIPSENVIVDERKVSIETAKIVYFRPIEKLMIMELLFTGTFLNIVIFEKNSSLFF